MKALAITIKGIEDVTSLEIKELIKAKIKEKKSTTIIFEPQELIDLCILCYKAQSVSRILYLFDYFDFEKKNDLLLKLTAIIEKIKLSQWFYKESTFRSKCNRYGNHDFSSQEIEQKIGEVIIDKIKKENNHTQKVNLDNPDIIIYIYIYNTTAYFGIDFSGFDLSKREYKLFGHSFSIKGNLAYALLRLSDYKKNQIILDPFSNSGEILIEAALFSSYFPVNYYRKNKFIFRKLKTFKKINFDQFFKKIDDKVKLRKKVYLFGFDDSTYNVNNSQKNAKIAGINNQIKFSKISLEWLDTKFNKNSVDKIITKISPYTKCRNKKDIGKLYQELFYQASYILKQSGLITTVIKNPELIIEKATKYNFKKIKKLDIKDNKVVIFKHVKKEHYI
jgi:23S rRNA G2445 N2-methylase RlmL